MDENRCAYQMVKEVFYNDFTAIHKMIHKKLHIEKIACCRVLHNLTEHQKEKRVRIRRETLKLLNDGGYRIVSKIPTDDEM